MMRRGLGSGGSGGSVLTVVWTVLLIGALFAQGGVAQSDVTQGTLRVVVEPGEKLLEFPLQHTDVKAQIAGMVAEVTVTQTFSNPYEDTIEAVYVFPLPQNAAVNDMTMKISDRTILGLIKEREEARQIYEEARQAGRTASLLEQERPNIFTQSVANIIPGATILIQIHYVQDLAYDHGTYEFTFPMVVGPRFIPGTPTGQTGGGWAPDTDRVPDASRITPPVLRPEERTGHDIALTVALDAGVPIQGLRCRSHEVVIERQSKRNATIALKPFDTLPNKDFMLAWDVAGDQPEMALITHGEEGAGYFTLMIQPKADFEAGEITPKEMIFVVDCSGSMKGEPIAKAKQAMRKCVAQMNPNDTFRIIRFSEGASQLSQDPLTANADDIKRGLHYIEQMSGSGGTQMIEGIKAALDYPPDPERLRIVCFMTDGKIGNETEILAAIEDRLRNARLFSFGVGTSVNRYLLERMAETGRGVVQYVRPNEDATEVVDRFYERIAKPYLIDLDINWGGMQVADLYPSKVPDLFADQPVILHGRYTEPGSGDISVRGRLTGKLWRQSLTIELPRDEPENEAVASLWGRARIKELMDSMHDGPDPDTVKQITDLAIEFRLMSAWTSFVAVEEKIVNEDGELKTIYQPVPMPESVSYEGVFGAGARGNAIAAAMGGPTVTGWIDYRIGLVGGQVLTGDVYDLGDRINEIEGMMGGTGSARLAHCVHSDQWLGSNPSSLPLLLVEAAQVISLPAGMLYPRGLAVEALAQAPDEAKLASIYLISTEAIELTEEQTTGLKAFVERGGFLILDGAETAFIASLPALLQQIAPGATIADLPADHDLLAGEKAIYPIAESAMMGIMLDGKLIGVVTGADLGAAWAGDRTADTETAFRQGINLVAWVLRR